ncbi:hypothetical protein F0344_22125 [Streptomyces finlayi]|uniref:Uncharacterized protein n=1 Tax=Streptomyces finlayi TaxID=67296 RepID=A0A7G7BNN8_9ACTN|nr:hypothetical protein [Streptomyces finlayi]QNE76953.1 hypothetical protein F0344_22125 [Streptomyces finlayi]
MPSVKGLLEERERAARQRVELLREEAERVLAALREAEAFWERKVVALEEVDDALAVGPESVAGGGVEVEDVLSAPPVVAGSVVPQWREGLSVSALTPDYQRIIGVLAGREADGADGDRSMICREIAAGLGLELVPAKVEGVRSKAKKMVARGWLIEVRAGRFTLADGLRGDGS